MVHMQTDAEYIEEIRKRLAALKADLFNDSVRFEFHNHAAEDIEWLLERQHPPRHVAVDAELLEHLRGPCHSWCGVLYCDDDCERRQACDAAHEQARRVLEEGEGE